VSETETASPPLHQQPEVDQAAVERQRKAEEMLASLKILRDMMAGAMNGEPGKSRLEMDPDGVANDLEEFAKFAKANLSLHTGPMDWKASMRVEPVDASNLVHLVDAPIPYILKPIIVEGSLTQIQGIPKGGKSAFSLLLSLCLASGTWPYPQYLCASEPTKVLYLAWEDPDIMMAKRLSLYAQGLGFDRKFSPAPGMLTFLFAPDLFIELGDHEAALRAAIEELKPKVIFIDTLSHVHAKDENSSSEMKIPMKALARVAKECGVGIVYLHHTGKAQKEHAQDKSRGSGAIAAAWHVLIDWGTREKGSNINPVEIQSKYEHNWKNWNIAYELVKDEFGAEQAVRWMFNDDSGDDSREGRVDTKRARIIDTMKRLRPSFSDGWMTAQDLVEPCGLGVDSKTIKRYLQPLCEEGIVQFREAHNSKDGKTPNTYRISEGNLVL